MASFQQVLQNVQGWPLNLDWDRHFRKVNSLGGMDALTHSLVTPPRRFTVRLHGGNYELRSVQVRVRLGSQTRVRRGFLSSATPAEKSHLLRHEQGHFDIAGLLARDLVSDLMDMAMDAALVEALQDSGNSPREYLRYAQRDIGPRARAAWAELRRLWLVIDQPDGPGGEHRGLYEKATRHGEDHAGQSRWNRMLDYAKTSHLSLSMTLSLFGEDPTNFPTLFG